MNKFLQNQILLRPITLVDIGCKGGVDAKWMVLKENLNVIGFEPNKEEYDRIQNVDSHRENPLRNRIDEFMRGHTKIYNTALWNEKRSIDFFVTRASRLCSCLEPNREVLDEFPETERFDVFRKE